VNSAFAHADWLAHGVISQVLFTSEQLKENKLLPILNKVTLKQVKSLFGLLVIQLLWYILCGLVNIHHFSPPLE